MGEKTILNYEQFLKELDKRIAKYFKEHADFIQCKAGCSACCEKGDYPISDIELEYLMQGYIKLENSIKKAVQENIKNMEKGGACPFLINKRCAVYRYRPIICRVHGLAYLCRGNTVKVPYCVHSGKNYAQVYKNGEICIKPVQENLDTTKLGLIYNEIRNLYDWLNHIPG